MEKIIDWGRSYNRYNQDYPTRGPVFLPEYAHKAIKHFIQYPDGEAIKAYHQNNQQSPEKPFHIYDQQKLPDYPEGSLLDFDELLQDIKELQQIEKYQEVAKGRDFPGLDQIRQERSRTLLEVSFNRATPITDQYNTDRNIVKNAVRVLSTPSKATVEEIDLTKTFLKTLNSLAETRESDITFRIYGGDHSFKKTDIGDALNCLVESQTRVNEYRNNKRGDNRDDDTIDPATSEALTELREVGDTLIANLGMSKDDQSWLSGIDAVTQVMDNRKKALRDTLLTLVDDTRTQTLDKETKTNIPPQLTNPDPRPTSNFKDPLREMVISKRIDNYIAWINRTCLIEESRVFLFYPSFYINENGTVNSLNILSFHFKKNMVY